MMRILRRLLETYGSSTWPGLALLALVVLMRLAGGFQGLELKTLDTLLRLRPAEPTDDRFLIVGIDEADIQALGTYPVPDQVLADLLHRLDRHQPRAVAIDIYRDFPVNPGHGALVQAWADFPYVVGIEQVLANPVAPPQTLPSDRIGFVDLPLDDDGFVRRILLGVYGADGVYRFALAIRLAEQYLAQYGLAMDNGYRDPEAMRFGTTELTRVHPHTGGYVRADAAGNQMLLNPRSGATPFRQVSLRQVMVGAVDPAWIEDAIVLVGITSLSVKDLVNSAAVSSENPGLVYGVEIQAHATSQIISAVLDDRPLLQVWSPGLEYGWIVVWGGLGIGWSLMARRLWISVLGSTALLGCLLGAGVGLMGMAVWVPMVVPAIAFVITSTITTSLRLSQAQQQQMMTLRLLGQQTSPEIAQALWDERQRLTEEGRLPAQTLTATILFSDIRNFTTLSEQQSPQQVMGWLNEYFMAMTEEVQRHHGVVNKFIGDGLMAVFGVPIPSTTPVAIATDAQQAVDCALAMAERLTQLNQQWSDQGYLPIQIRIGIFTGPVMVGSLGGSQRLEYGVVGDSVNTASRLESCFKHRQPTPCRILIAHETLVHLNNQIQVESWGEIPLRGKQNTVRVYRVCHRSISSF
ncbi:adenylate/guanylate cyclase domain-containing protein [Nodosilinea sp. P-1105]|uniref:CHASE2 domain-containing protein n=1 Tax=Nodosilinea sp. P-1105 TaxID=2546229 RepID=UPI00146DC786|nr:adenylate/guanylate cyclase domain-containing protein [Nodosilinea sp. P-1105]NMF84983.1 adenylate/guanylate cyclase domain-containing protein [Nodosilinea sp. P-1105]